MKTRPTTNPPEAESRKSTHKIEEKYIMDKKETSSSSNLSKEAKTETRKIIELMDYVCSIKYFNFRSLIEKHDLCTGEDISRQLNFSWLTLPTTCGKIKKVVVLNMISSA